MEINCNLCYSKIGVFYQIKTKDNKELEICETCFVRLGGSLSHDFYNKPSEELAKEVFFAFEEVKGEHNNLEGFPSFNYGIIKTKAHRTNKTKAELLGIYKKSRELEKSAKKKGGNR